MSENTQPSHRKRGPGLATQVLLALTLGVFAGLFFGERMAVLDVVGLGFIRLLQMTVLPYVVVSLLAGLGRLQARQAARLGWRAALILLALWTTGLIFVALTPLVFPGWDSASFYSPSLVETSHSFNVIDLYFTHNPFHALSNTIVPAVVLFTIALGVALIAVPGKRGLMDTLTVLGSALTRIAQFVVKLAPIGVFAIVAGTAGTIDLDDLGRIQVYVFSQAAVATLLAFVVLPAAVSLLTPVSYGQLIRRLWSAMITAFATGSVFVVLPLLAEASRELLESAGLDEESTNSSVEVVVPASFNFPSLGTILSVGFVIFAGWFVGSPIAVTQYPGLLVTGLVSMFGAPTLAIPFLLDMQQLPADLFDLYLAVDVVGSRFGMMLAAMQVATLAILAACAMGGRLRVRWSRLMPAGAIVLIATIVVFSSLGLFFSRVLENEYLGYHDFVSLTLLGEPVPSRIVDDPDQLSTDDRPSLDRIAERGLLRVCYRTDGLPFAFVNASSDLVGYDVELAHALARELGVDLEFVRVPLKAWPQPVLDGRCDVGLNVTAVTPERSRQVAFTPSHFEGSLALVVRDHRRDDFNSRTALKKQTGLKLAMLSGAYYERVIRAYLPGVEILSIDTPRDFFRAEQGTFDALAFPAEAAAAWTLVYPGFSVAVPKPDVLAIPLAYVVRLGDDEWQRYLTTWLSLKKSDGTFDRLYAHWILGQAAGSAGARWCIARDVLHWID
jgi:Na+/H+-dicarboxylate symporter/ABC-type amino acid transport substrate-binding protein